jgi:acetyl-CoA synthetase
MLGNVPELWETLLAAMKLGAVVNPATMLLTEADLADRIERGRVRHIICSAELASKLETVGAHCTRISVGGAAAGWLAFEHGYKSPLKFTADGETRGDDPLQLYSLQAPPLSPSW